MEWWQGYLVLEINGKQLERLVNLAVGQGLTIWSIQKKGPDKGQLSILLDDFYRLRPLLRKTDCRVRILRRGGLPFFTVSMKKRIGFVAGIMIFLIGLYAFSGMIWTVEVVGNEEIEEARVLELAEQLGIERGSFKFKVPPPEDVQQYLLQEMDRASWIGFRIEGTRAIIQVVEKVVPEEQKDLNPRHLIAKKRATIHEIFVEQGRPRVKVHDMVNPGDILVSGIIGNEQNYDMIPAKGKIMGEVWYETEVSVPLTMKPVQYTGESHRNDYLLIGSYAVKINGYDEISFDQYETETERKYLHVRDFRIPLGWKTEVLKETRNQQIKMSEEEAVRLGIKMARQDVLSRVKDGRIKKEKVLRKQLDNDKVYMKIHFAVIEEISKEKPILDPNPFEKNETENDG